MRSRTWIVIFLFGGVLGEGYYCHKKLEEPNYENHEPITELEQKFVSSSKLNNAEAKRYDGGAGDDQFPILHLFGEGAYDFGYLQGTLMKNETIGFLNELYEYYVHFFEDEFAFEILADKVRKVTDKYVKKAYKDEMKGLSDATGVSLDKIERIHILGELWRVSCTIIGVWDEAISKKQGLLQLRALDWDLDAPYRKYPQITVIHRPDGISFMNVGFSGFVGLITGVNDKQIGISEMGPWYVDHDVFVGENPDGLPFTWMMREVLEDYDNGADIVDYMKNINRTVSLLFGIGDGKKSDFDHFKGVSYSSDRIEFYSDENMEATLQVNETEPMRHDRIKDAVYYSRDWFCPTFNGQVMDRINANWGNITAEILIRDITARTNTGDMHSAVYDFNDDAVYLSFAKKTDDLRGPIEAYKRGYTKIDLSLLFQTKQL